MRRLVLLAAMWCPLALARNASLFAALILSAPTLSTAAVDGMVQRSLATPSRPGGTTMFTEMLPEETGFVTENRYADPRMWAERYHEFGVGAIGTGVAIGDYDDDGRPDIFVVSKTETCRLFRNLGDWKFEDVTAKAGVRDVGAAAAEWKQGAAFADVNNDGWLDLYVCRFAAPNLLYINRGDGTFEEEAGKRGLALNDASGMAAFCDYDRDGWLDVYVQTNLLNSSSAPNGQRDRLYRNRGDGFFVDVSDGAGIAGASQGHSATWWDHDDDGWPDLYVANDFAAPDVLYRNNGDGTFTDVIGRAVPHVPYSAMGADYGDVNNDGRIDFLVADMAATNRQKDLRGMADSRARGQEDYDVSRLPLQYPRNALYLNTGDGHPAREAAILAGLAATDWTWAPRFEDLDNDGRLDLFVTTGMNREQHNVDLLARMMAAENPADRSRIMRASPVLKEANLAYRNLGDLEFESVGEAWGLAHKGVSFGSALGDLDGDGDLDLVFTNYQGGAILLRNDSVEGGRLIVELRGTASNRFGVGAKVTIETKAGMQVRTLGLARGYLSTSEPVLHFGLGSDSRIERLRIEWPSGRTQEFDSILAGQRCRVTEPSDGTGASERKEGAGETLFQNVSSEMGFAYQAEEDVVDETAQQPLLPFRLNRRGPALAVGDIDGDGREEVVIGGTTKTGAGVLRSDAAGPLKQVVQLPPRGAVNDGPVLVFDANGDGANDLLFTSGGVAAPVGSPDYAPRLFLNDGRGGMLPGDGTLPRFSMCVGAAAAADFDRDGQLDVFLGARVTPGFYPEKARSVLLGNRGSRFEDITDTLAPGLADVGLVTAALWSDVDADGWIDLLVATEWGPVRVFRNRGGEGFEDRTQELGFAHGGTGWWTALATADFNRDGRPDYAAGNAGLNTPYTATAERPALLFYGVFREHGDPLIVEAGFDGDRLTPLRSRRELGARIPELLKRFPRNDVFARASLEDVFGRDRLAGAQRFGATELCSGVFLSQPDGTFAFRALPRMAQIAPMQGIVAGDVDGDGMADIVAVQNSYAPVFSIGHFDGGLGQFLRGDGRGEFVAVEPMAGGLIVPGDAKSLVTVDLDRDRWPDVLVTRNNNTTLAFRTRPMADREFFSVILNGAGGNRTAVGACVEVEHVSGARQLLEVHAGSGYQSQSSAELHFGQASSDPARKLRVRWPTGRLTEHAIAAGAETLTISHP